MTNKERETDARWLADNEIQDEESCKCLAFGLETSTICSNLCWF
jgi:hypothetical protein